MLFRIPKNSLDNVIDLCYDTNGKLPSMTSFKVMLYSTFSKTLTNVSWHNISSSPN